VKVICGELFRIIVFVYTQGPKVPLATFLSSKSRKYILLRTGEILRANWFQEPAHVKCKMYLSREWHKYFA